MFAPALKLEIEKKGYPIEEGPVIRYGALGEMKSILVELCSYQ